MDGEGAAHRPRDGAQCDVEDDGDEEERRCCHELGPGHAVLVGALGEGSSRRRDGRQTENELKDEGAVVGGAPTLTQAVGEDELKCDGCQAQEGGDDACASFEPPRGSQRPTHLPERALGGGGHDRQGSRARPAQGGDGSQLAADRDVVEGVGALSAHASKPCGHHAREESPHARVGDRGPEDCGRQDEDADEKETGAPAPVGGQRLRGRTHERDEDEAGAPQASRVDGLSPGGEETGEERQRQPGGGDADDLSGRGGGDPRAGTQVPLGRTARDDHNDDAEHGRRDEAAGNRADGGEDGPPVGAGRVGFEGLELAAPHPVGRRGDHERDSQDRSGGAA